MARHRANRSTPSPIPAHRHQHRVQHVADYRRRSFAVLPIMLLLLSATTALAPLADRGTAPALPVGNLVPDPEFAHGTQGWTVTEGTTVQVVAGRAGHQALAITNVTSAPKTINLNDAPNTIARTSRGVTFTASAWIRVSVPTLSVAVRQAAWTGSVAHGRPALGSAWLPTGAWHFLRVAFTAPVSGASIDLNILAWQLPPGVTVFVGQPSLTSREATASGSASAPSATPPTSRTAPSTTAPASTRPTPGTTSATASKSAPVKSAPTSLSSGAKLVFDDEFNGTSVDRSKWNVRDKSWASNELSIDTARSNNVSVSSGVLTLRAQRERYTAYSTTRDYTSGYLDTIGLMSRQYGRWEMRAKLPSAKGLWPAFWLRSDHSPGEIDILEAIGGLPQVTVQTAFPDTNDGSVKRSNAYTVSASKGTSAWHVYGMTWTPTSLAWDVDGAVVFRLNAADVPWVSSALKDTMSIRLNLQVGGSMPAYFNKRVDGGTPFPADYQVDYVRVYDR